ncbi:hypothetical protein BDR26DRAFT_388103 [Obelidium mucronatum]|nr:hypothetical protein BDR26DRAFT_388103 [Obelidium mucronatum]
MELSEINKKLEKLYNERQALQGERKDLTTKIDNTDGDDKIEIYKEQLKECGEQMKANTEETKPLLAARNELLTKQGSLLPLQVPNVALTPSLQPAESNTPTTSLSPVQNGPLPALPTTISKPWTIFMSYCWRNSKEAKDKGELGIAEPKTGPCDPRQLARDLSKNGYSTWLDVDRLKSGKRFFEDLHEAILTSKFAIICMSEQYLASENCKLELKFIARIKVPFIVIIVGNTPCQWTKSCAGFIASDTPYYDTTNQPINMSELTKSLPSISSLTTVSDPLQALEDDAKGGDAASQFRMGLRFDSNFGSPTADDKLAFEWYLKAAESGHAEAQNNLAVMYEKGHGVSVSLPKALHWYTLAADNGELQAQFNLALLYEKEREVTNYTMAKAYYEKAVKAGHSGVCNTMLDSFYQFLSVS